MREPLKVLLYDDTQHGLKKLELSKLWDLGSNLGGFDRVVAAKSVADAKSRLTIIAEVARMDDRKIVLQIWCHGNEGILKIGTETLEVQDIADAVGLQLKLLWARACNLFADEKGRKWIAEAQRKLQCDLAGFTRVVSSPFFTHQSGLYALHKDDEPFWPLTETGYSAPWKPRTILTTRMKLPDWAFVR